MGTKNREDAAEVDDDLGDTLDDRADDVLAGDFVTSDEHEERRSE